MSTLNRAEVVGRLIHQRRGRKRFHADASASDMPVFCCPRLTSLRSLRRIIFLLLRDERRLISCCLLQSDDRDWTGIRRLKKKEKKRGRENEMLQREKKDEEKHDLLIQLVDWPSDGLLYTQPVEPLGHCLRLLTVKSIPFSPVCLDLIPPFLADGLISRKLRMNSSRS